MPKRLILRFAVVSLIDFDNPPYLAPHQTSYKIYFHDTAFLSSLIQTACVIYALTIEEDVEMTLNL